MLVTMKPKRGNSSPRCHARCCDYILHANMFLSINGIFEPIPVVLNPIDQFDLRNEGRYMERESAGTYGNKTERTFVYKWQMGRSLSR